MIEVGPDKYEVPTQSVVSGNLIFMGDMQRLSSVSEALVIRFQHLPELIVPETATGFWDLVSWLESNRSLTRSPV